MTNNNKQRNKKYMYGKIYHDTFEIRNSLNGLFSQFFNDHSGLDIETHNDIVKLRNKVGALIRSWMGSVKIQKKYGIKIPLHSTPISVGTFIEKQASSFYNIYKPCEICGENRITNYCHILPYSEGGPSHSNNYIILCPTHHHLFDHNRLKKIEWDKINFSNKLEASQKYIEKVKLPPIKKYWEKDR